MLVTGDKRYKTAVALIICILLQLVFQPVIAKAEMAPATGIDFTQVTGALAPGNEMFSTARLWSDTTHLVDNDKIPVNIELVLDTSDDSRMQQICSNLIEQAFADGDLYEADNEQDKPASTTEEIEQYINNLDDEKLAPITFICTFAGTQLLDDEIFAHAGMIYDQSNEDIGSYEMTEADGNVQLSITFEKKVYARTDISYKFSGWLKLSDSASDRVQPLFLYDSETQTISFDLTKEPVPVQDSEAEFIISKTAVVSGNGIDYTITAKGYQKESLNPVSMEQKTIFDAIPQGLEIVSVEAMGAVADPNTYMINSQSFSYIIPEYTALTEDMAYTIVLHTKMSDDYFIQMIQNGDGEAQEFTNTAQLLSSQDDSILAESDPVTSEIELKSLDKTGMTGANGRFMNWTLNGTLYFTDAANVYVIDSIDNINEHDYTGNTISITYTKTDKSQEQITCAMEDIPAGMEKKSFQDITLEDCAAYTSSGASVICYRMDTDLDGTEDQAVLIIPMASAKGITDEFNHLHGTFEIHYATEVKDVHVDDSGTVKELGNQARLVWEWVNLYGIGPSIERYASADIDKTVKTNYSLVEKSAGTYSETTQTLTWNFVINRYGTDITSIDITDCLDMTKLKLKNSYTTGSTLSLASSKSGSMDVSYAEGTPSESENYFTVTMDGQNQMITIHLTDIAQDDKLSFSLDTIVTDLSILASQGVKDKKVINTATAAAIVAESPITKKITGSLLISNTLLVKNAIDFSYGTYDYEKHAVKWQVIVNPDFLPVDDAVLTETLPDGVLFGEITSIQRIDASGAVIATVTDVDISQPVSIGDDQQVMYADASDEESTAFTLSFSEQVHDKYIIEYTSTFSQEYRNQNFASNQDVEIPSDSMLEGRIDTAQLYDVDDSATHTLTIPFLEKSGVYSTNLSVLGISHIPHIEWTIDLNPMEINVEGAQIKDILSNCYELLTDDTDTVSVSVVTKNADGTDLLVTDITDAVASAGALVISTHGINFTVPETASLSSIRVRIITTFTEDTDKDNMINEASISGGTLSARSTSETKATNAESVSMEDFAASNKPKYVKVTKTSVNSIIQNDHPLYHIQSAVFTLTALKYESGSWVSDPSISVKTRTTQSNGSCSFMFLRKDTVYRIEEVTAPAGYQLPEHAYSYFYFNDDTSSENYAHISADMLADMMTVIGADNYSAAVTVQDEPGTASDEGGIVSFYKITDDDTDTPIPNVEFTLTDANGKLITRHAVSDEQGLVSFTHLDPGTYYITEEFNEYCEPVNGYLIATVSVSGSYQTEIANGPLTGENPISIQKTAGSYYVMNTLSQPLPTPTATPTPAATPTPLPYEETPVASPSPTPAPSATPAPSLTPSVTPSAVPTITPDPSVDSAPMVSPVPTKIPDGTSDDDAKKSSVDSAELPSSTPPKKDDPIVVPPVSVTNDEESTDSKPPRTGDSSILPVYWLMSCAGILAAVTRKKKKSLNKQG